jgi:hypothetical protein
MEEDDFEDMNVNQGGDRLGSDMSVAAIAADDQHSEM